MAFIIRTRRDELYVKYCRQPGTRLNAILTDIEQGLSLLDICIRYGTDFETVLMCNAVYKKYKGVGMAPRCVDKWHDAVTEQEPAKQSTDENGRCKELLCGDAKRKAMQRIEVLGTELLRQSLDQSGKARLRQSYARI